MSVPEFPRLDDLPGARGHVPAEDGHGDRADASRHRSDPAGPLGDLLEGDVADQAASRSVRLRSHAVDPDVDHHGARLHHLGGDQARLADRDDQDVSAARLLAIAATFFEGIFLTSLTLPAVS